MSGMKDEYGLTVKQRKFAENVVSGMNLADSYRNSYDASDMKPASVQRRAAELMVDGKIRACIEALQREMRERVQITTVSDRDKVATKLRSWLDGEAATQSQLRAAELLGKACGMFRDVVEDHRERPATLVAAELEARLTALLPAPDQPDGLNADAEDDDSGADDSLSLVAGSDPAGSGETTH